MSMLNICTKCGYVQRKLVCLLLPTSSVNNNNNTCGFIYISMSCDYLICHQNPSMHEMFISLSSDNRLFYKKKNKDDHPKFNFLHFIGNYFRNLKVKSINASL